MQENFSLIERNTFHIDAKTRYFCEAHSVKELQQAITFAGEMQLEFFVLGGGSNIVFTKDFGGVVIANCLQGIREEVIDENQVRIVAQAGENWHQLVLYCISKNYGGIENLSLIPGNVGTTPIQNIGAYGVEIKDVFEYCKVLDISDFSIKTLSREECRFGYRDSIFKHEAKGKYIVLEVAYLLTTQKHKISASYGAIQTELSSEGVKNPSIADISKAVIHIRESKLPNPKLVGNCGSFFKNPVVEEAVFLHLKNLYEEIPHYPSGKKVKIPAAWLIEKAGWKGKTMGNVGCHEKQALVIINATGRATGKEVYDFSEQIVASVQQNFGIELEREVNII